MKKDPVQCCQVSPYVVVFAEQGQSIILLSAFVLSFSFFFCSVKKTFFTASKNVFHFLKDKFFHEIKF
jgi:hypothetical protein